MQGNTPFIIVLTVGAIGAALGGAYFASQSPQSPPPVTQLPTQSPQSPQSSPSPPSSPSTQSSPPPTPQPIMITPSQDNCKITAAIVSDPNPPANVRSSPEVTATNLLGTLTNGTYLSVTEEQNGWFKINSPVEGWVAKSITESSCSEITERIKFPPNGTSARVKGRIIGGGSHQYLLKASAGQTLTLSVSEGALPFVFIPNDPNQQNDLTGGGHYTGLENWSGTLPTTGDYLLVLDSHFRGLTYDFLVEVK